MCWLVVTLSLHATYGPESIDVYVPTIHTLRVHADEKANASEPRRDVSEGMDISRSTRTSTRTNHYDRPATQCAEPVKPNRKAKGRVGFLPNRTVLEQLLPEIMLRAVTPSVEDKKESGSAGWSTGLLALAAIIFFNSIRERASNPPITHQIGSHLGPAK
jgi:hypothetical protein